MSTSLNELAIHIPGAWKVWWVNQHSPKKILLCLAVFPSSLGAETYRDWLLELRGDIDHQYIITPGYVTGIRFEEEVPKP